MQANPATRITRIFAISIFPSNFLHQIEMSTQLHKQIIIFPDGSCGNNTPVADTPPILLENILLDQPKNLRFFTTAIFRPNQHITSISVHRGTQQVLLDFPYSVTEWRWLHTTGSTHTTDSITLPSLKKYGSLPIPKMIAP